MVASIAISILLAYRRALAGSGAAVQLFESPTYWSGCKSENRVWDKAEQSIALRTLTAFPQQTSRARPAAGLF